MDDRFNTIAGWVLGAGIVALGASLFTGEVFSADRPDNMGYPIEGVEVEAEGGEAEQPIAFFMQAADAAAGEQVYKKCAACHTVARGGVNGLGPNLFGTMGAQIAHVAGFNYSPALQEKAGSWDWEAMSQWLKSPRTFAPGTKMTFAGLSNPEDRANLMAYLNSQGSNLPLPAAPAVSPQVAAAEASDAPAESGKAEDQPVLTEGQAAKQPAGNVAGEGAPAVSGRAEQTKTGQ